MNHTKEPSKKTNLTRSVSFIFRSVSNSLVRCRLCDLCTVRCRTDHSAIRLVHRPFDRCIGRTHHRAARTEKFRAKIAQATRVVGGSGHLYGVHDIRRRLQFIKYRYGAATGRKWGGENRAVDTRFWYLNKFECVNSSSYREWNNWINSGECVSCGVRSIAYSNSYTCIEKSVCNRKEIMERRRRRRRRWNKQPKK